MWKLGRFARNREDSIIYKGLLRKHGVQVISINEPLDDSPTGRMMEGIIEVLDEFYSANLAQEVVRGMREAASRGYWVNPKAPYGYQLGKVQDGSRTRVTLEPDPKTAWVVRWMFQMARDAMGVKEIAKALNGEMIPSPRGKRWGKSGVHVILKNEVYTGTLVWGRGGRYHRETRLEPVRVPGSLPALVDEETFSFVQQVLRTRAPKVTPPRRVSSPYLLSGLLRCGSCGASMFGTAAKSGRFHYYTCATAYRSGRQACGEKSVPQQMMESLVLDKVRDLILRDSHIEELVRLTNEELEGSLASMRVKMNHLDSQLGEINGRLERVYDALETGKVDLDDLAPRIRELKQRKDLVVSPTGSDIPWW